jgi:uncharacterized protein (TIGR02453 family)
MMTEEFQGFPLEGIQFLRDLEQNNNKEWFEANRLMYRKAVQEPALSLVETLGQQLQAEYPGISYDTRANGGSLMRIYRDTRFSADKAPYKTNVAMMFTLEGYKRMEAPGFGLQITPQQVELVAGMFAFSKPQLEAYREGVVEKKSGTALLAAVEQIHSAGAYTFSEPSLKRVPRGYDVEHPRADWLKHKGLSVFSPPIPLEVVYTPNLISTAMIHFRNMAPIQQWLVRVLKV